MRKSRKALQHQCHHPQTQILRALRFRPRLFIEFILANLAIERAQHGANRRSNMVDPTSITTGIVGILSSLTTLSMRINDLRKDFKGAADEINQLTREVDNLRLILKRIDEQNPLQIPPNLANELPSILSTLNTSIVETDILLRKVSQKKFRSAYWAFSGKKECTELCKKLESYKSTLNLALTLSTV